MSTRYLAFLRATLAVSELGYADGEPVADKDHRVMFVDRPVSHQGSWPVSNARGMCSSPPHASGWPHARITERNR